MVRLGWVKAHVGILRVKAANVLAKSAMEGVPLDDHEKWLFGGYKAVGEAAEEGIFERR